VTNLLSEVAKVVGVHPNTVPADKTGFEAEDRHLAWVPER